MARASEMRARLAEEAARIIDQEGLRDFHAAKRKAAARLGAGDTRHLPSNSEIEAALLRYQRLFRGPEQTDQLQMLRRTALAAMRELASFEPRLVGDVLSGSADAHSEVRLHLFADTPEDVAFHLMQQRIPFQTGERRVRYGTAPQPVGVPSYRFVAGEVSIELVVFGRDDLRQAPLSPVDGRPMRRAGCVEVERLLQETG